MYPGVYLRDCLSTTRKSCSAHMIISELCADFEISVAQKPERPQSEAEQGNQLCHNLLQVYSNAVNC